MTAPHPAGRGDPPPAGSILLDPDGGRSTGRHDESASARGPVVPADRPGDRGERRARAEAIGRRLGDLIGQPDELAGVAVVRLRDLADPAYAESERRVAPGLGPTHGIPWPLLRAVSRGFARSTRSDRPAVLLAVAERLLRVDTLDEHWLAFDILERVLPSEPELAWQLLRAAASRAADWITVDSLAHAYGRGILLADYRWAEIGQLVYSPSRWERRLVGSTVATIPFIDRRLGRDPTVAERALPILHDLIGDDAPEVQKALAWALRSLTLVDPEAVLAACSREAETARATSDGNRAWVVRDVLPKLEPSEAERLRALLSGIRRRPGAPPTSRASEIANAFAPAGLPPPPSHPRPPLPATPPPTPAAKERIARP
ncbi:MAG TPA: DNA alkylation repair protein [Candidatus Dormibacteraeota bacterium]|nr:DNA alkylation repair protein [Candidatus Dormibacteraeota bacterium]